MNLNPTTTTTTEQTNAFEEEKDMDMTNPSYLRDGLTRHRSNRSTNSREEDVENRNIQEESDNHPHHVADITSSTFPSAIPYHKTSQCKELLVCLVFFLAVLGAHTVSLQPNERPIPFQQLLQNGDYVRNLTNNESFESDTIPDTLLVILALILPLILQLVFSFLRLKWYLPGDVAAPKRYYDFHATICVYLVAIAINMLATESTKLYVGYLRPMFYQGCQPDDNYQACTVDDTDDMRKSFPSGHSSMSFCGLTLLTLFLHTQFGMGYARQKIMEQQQWIMLSQQQGTTQGTLNAEQLPHHAWKLNYRARFISICSLLPMALALFIASSRVVDNKHFPADIVAGAVLGSSIAMFTHSLWF